MNILFGTHYIDKDEPCLGLYEMNLQSPGSKGFHRYQIIYVMRDDKPTEYRKDMGLSKWFKHDQFRIPGGAFDNGRYWIEHTVAELMEIADQLRFKPSFDKRELVQCDNIKEAWQTGTN